MRKAKPITYKKGFILHERELEAAAEKHIGLALSAYRLTLAMCHLNSEQEEGKGQALDFVTSDFMDALDKEFPDINRGQQELAFNYLISIIKKAQGWSEYVCGDAVNLLMKISNIPDGVDANEWRLQHYHERMQNQLDTLKLYNQQFTCRSAGQFSILDIGCGSLSYFKRLMGAGKTEFAGRLDEYIGIDKRKQFDWSDEPDLLKDKLTFIPITYEQYFKELGCNNTNMVYLFELLHCVPDIKELFELIVNNLQKLKCIKIIEVDTSEDYGIGFGFHYHMAMHSNRFNLQQIEDCLQWVCYTYDFTITTSRPTSQHMMFTLEKR